MNEKLNPLKPRAVSGDKPVPCGYPAWLEDLDTGTKYLIPYGSWTLGRQSEESEVDIPIRTSADNMLYISKKQGIVTLKRNLIGENALYLRDCENVANPSNVEGFETNRFFNYQILHEDLVQIGATFFRAYLNQPGEE